MSHIISIKPVIDNRDEAVAVSGVVPRDTHVLGDLEFTVLGPAHYEGTLQHLGDGIRFAGTVDLPVTAGCVRCLEAFDTVIRGRFDQMFYFEPTVNDEGDPEPTVGDGYDIDVESVLNEALVVSTPFAPVHDADCQGLCSHCGCNLNEEECSCGDDIDPSHPLAGLKDLI